MLSFLLHICEDVIYAIASLWTYRKETKHKEISQLFFKREKMITIDSTTCHTISGPKLSEQDQNFEPGLLLPWFVVCHKSSDRKVKYAIEDSTLMAFPSYPCFSASCSHRDSTTKIQEARATALAERDSS